MRDKLFYKAKINFTLKVISEIYPDDFIKNNIKDVFIYENDIIELHKLKDDSFEANHIELNYSHSSPYLKPRYLINKINRSNKAMKSILFNGYSAGFNHPYLNRLNDILHTNDSVKYLINENLIDVTSQYLRKKTLEKLLN